MKYVKRYTKGKNPPKYIKKYLKKKIKTAKNYPKKTIPQNI